MGSSADAIRPRVEIYTRSAAPKTDYTDQQSTDTQSESSRDKIDVASPNSIEETSVNDGKQPSGAAKTLSRNKNNQKELANLSIQTSSKKEVGCDITKSSASRV